MIEYFDDEQPTEYTYTINDVEYTFKIYSSGKVVYSDTYEVICSDGAEDCPDEYVTNITYTLVNAT